MSEDMIEKLKRGIVTKPIDQVPKGIYKDSEFPSTMYRPMPNKEYKKVSLQNDETLKEIKKVLESSNAEEKGNELIRKILRGR